MGLSDMKSILDGPAATPPPGKTSNLENPPQQMVVSYVVAILSVLITVFSVLVRMYTRIFVTKQVNYADYFLFTGLLFYLGFIGVVSQIAHFGPGVHQWDLSFRDYGSFLYWYHVDSILYGFVICFIKLSILSQYIQIFMPTKNPVVLYWITIFIMAANVISYVVFTFLEIFACHPLSKAWEPLMKEGHCINILALNTGATSVNTGSDFIILFLPQLIIWRLNMNWKNKAAVSVVFMFAILAIASAIVRLYYCVRLQRTDDMTYYSWLAGMWALPEITFGFLVACLPAFPQFFRNVTQSKFYLSISSLLHSMRTRSSKGTGGRSSGGYILDEQPSAWPPTSSGQTKASIQATYGGDTRSGSDEGLTAIPGREPWIERQAV